ncbi:MAG: hypothetical protein WB622_03760 [Acidobacteriaceae bacterium]
MTDPNDLKPLKDENRLSLWLIIAFNSLFLYAVAQENAIRLEGIHAAISNAGNLIPVGFAIVAATVVNGILSDETKNRLVFLRWHNALPGHRAFSKYALDDPRIQIQVLQAVCAPDWPTTPKTENQKWYLLYRGVADRPPVRQVHRDFLLLRDYAGMAALMVPIYGGAATYTVESLRVAVVYGLLLMAQFLVVRHSARNYGISFVRTVLAQVSVPSPNPTR